MERDVTGIAGADGSALARNPLTAPVAAGDSARGGAASPGRVARRRCRPPRRPRRLRFLSPVAVSAVSPGAATTVAAVSASGVSSSVASLSAACAAGAATVSIFFGMRGFFGFRGFRFRAGDGCAYTGIGAPSRVRASSAFVRHCARRKCSAAVVYHRIASSPASAFSCHCASSNATMASRVRSYRLMSCPDGSLLAFALRMRAWICRQSAMGQHCSSQTTLRLYRT